MSAQMENTTVILLLTAPTPKDLFIALVTQDILEMEFPVQVIIHEFIMSLSDRCTTYNKVLSFSKPSFPPSKLYAKTIHSNWQLQPFCQVRYWDHYNYVKVEFSRRLTSNLILLDIDECVTGRQNCHADANCTNTKGSYYCTCHTGYSGDGVTCQGRLNVINLVLKDWKPSIFYILYRRFL